MKAKLFTLAAFVAVMAQAQNSENVMINEVMQSNIDYLMIEKDYPDSWVELYNPTAKSVSLGGYRIGEKCDFNKAYALPSSTSINANGHLIIYCDKENHGLHTDFRVDAGKASLYLFNPQGEAIDSVLMDDMPAANIAYGRITDGATEWQYQVNPSAGTSNTGVVSDLLLPEPEFSVKGCVVGDETSLLSVKISIPEGVELPEDTRLYITNDGSEPTLSSRSFPESFTFNLTKTTVIRAKLMSKQALSRRATTNSYIFHPRAADIPVVSIVTDHNNLYSTDYGILTGTVNDGKPNYMQKWRRPINIEYYDLNADEPLVFNQLSETAVSGVSTREQPQKSMKVYANKRFEKKTFKGNFWTDKPEVKKVKSFVLRSGGNNSFTTRINDAAIQKLFGTHVPELDWQAYQPVIVYINGSYAGEFGMRERADEDFIEANYDEDKVECADETSYQTPESGSLFADFYNSYQSASTTYADLDNQMDMSNFAASLVAEMFAMNTDFPTNNVAMWRPLAEEGKWRWILKDLDRAGMNLALYPAEFNMFRYIFNPDDLQYGGMHHFDIYKKMISLPEFRERFIDLMTVQLGDFLKPSVTDALLEAMKEEVYSELQPTFYAYNCITEWSKFNANFKNLKRFFADRPTYLYSQMAEYFNLGSVVNLQVKNNEQDITINDISLLEGDFEGSYFTNRPLRLNSGAEDKTWKMTITHKNGDVEDISFSTSTPEISFADYLTSDKDKLTISLETVEANTEPSGDETSISTASSASKNSATHNLQGVKITPSSARSSEIHIIDGKKIIKK